MSFNAYIFIKQCYTFILSFKPLKSLEVCSLPAFQFSIPSLCFYSNSLHKIITSDVVYSFSSQLRAFFFIIYHFTEVLFLFVVYLKWLGSKTESRGNSQVVRALKQKSNNSSNKIRVQALRLSGSATRVGSRDLKEQREVY